MENKIDSLIMPQSTVKGDWDAAAFFRRLTEKNKLARKGGYTFCLVSGLAGLEDVLQNWQESLAFVCVSDISDGYTDISRTPAQKRVKTVFLVKRHAVDDMEARNAAMSELREIFRQFMTVLTRQQTRLSQECIYLEPRISFSEIERYFAPGAACAYFQIAVNLRTSLEFDADEWE